MKNKKLLKYCNEEVLPVFEEIDKKNQSTKVIQSEEAFYVNLIQETMRKFRELNRPRVKDQNGSRSLQDIEFIDKTNLKSIPKSIYISNLHNIHVPSDFKLLSDEEQLIWENDWKELRDKSNPIFAINIPKWLANEKKAYDWNVNGYITKIINENNKKLKETEKTVTYATKEEIQSYEESVEDLLVEFVCTIKESRCTNIKKDFYGLTVKGATLSSYLNYYQTGRGSALSPFIFRKFLVAYIQKWEENHG